MAKQRHNWLSYIIVCAIMLIPLQNGMAAMSAVVDTSSVSKQVFQQMDHANHQADASVQVELQKHDGSCCEQDKICQQQCADCTYCPVVSAVLNNIPSRHIQSLSHLYSAVSILPDTTSISPQFRPPRV